MPRPAGRRPAPARRPPASRRRRGLRLTGLGSGVLLTAAMVAAAWLSGLPAGGRALYGVLFVLACAAASLWVRTADLVCAPIAAPPAFAAGLLATAGPLGTVTELALRAPWLFAGTLVAVAVTGTRAALRAALRPRTPVARAPRGGGPGGR